MDEKTKTLAVTGLGLSVALIAASKLFMRKKVDDDKVISNKKVVLLGDVGGTNTRLTLRCLDLTSRTSIEIKQLTKFSSQKTQSFEETVEQFLSVWLFFLILYRTSQAKTIHKSQS